MGALWELVRLRILTGCRRRRCSSYLRWRSETAYGGWEKELAGQMRRRDLLHLGAWIRRMRRDFM